MNLEGLARSLIGMALVLLLVGGVLLAFARLGWHRLPGDLAFEGRHWKVYVPLATSILVSVVLTVILNLIARFWR